MTIPLRRVTDRRNMAPVPSRFRSGGLGTRRGSVGVVTDTSFTVSWSSVVSGALWVFASSVVLLDLVLWAGSSAGHLGNLVGLIALGWTLTARMKRCQAANAAGVARALARNEVIDGLSRSGPQRIS